MELRAKSVGAKIAISILLIAGVTTFLWKGSLTASSGVNSDPGEAVSQDPQLDFQNGVKVKAIYLPEDSSQTQSSVLIEITSDTVDLSEYNFSEKIVWADTNIEALPTLSSSATEKSAGKVVVTATFVRRGSHHHLLIKDLAGIKDRVLHFYL